MSASVKRALQKLTHLVFSAMLSKEEKNKKTKKT